MKTAIKIATAIGGVIIALYLIGIVIVACWNIIVGLAMVAFGAVILIAIYVLGAAGATLLNKNTTNNPTNTNE